jgi:hypothetical protein
MNMGSKRCVATLLADVFTPDKRPIRGDNSDAAGNISRRPTVFNTDPDLAEGFKIYTLNAQVGFSATGRKLGIIAIDCVEGNGRGW